MGRSRRAHSFDGGVPVPGALRVEAESFTTMTVPGSANSRVTVYPTAGARAFLAGMTVMFDVGV